MNVDDNEKVYQFLVADDHSLIRQGVVFMVEDLEISTQIQQVNTLEKVLECVRKSFFDVIILDAHFPDGNSLTVIPEIRKLYADSKILVFSGIDENPHALKYFNAGANGFVSKLSDEEEIVGAIRNIVTNGEYISEVSKSLLLDSLRNKSNYDPLSLLSDRELQIAKLYAEGLGNLEIANQLDIRQNTVSTVKKRIFEKLKIDNLVELIELIKSYS